MQASCFVVEFAVDCSYCTPDPDVDDYVQVQLTLHLVLNEHEFRKHKKDGFTNLHAEIYAAVRKAYSSLDVEDYRFVRKLDGCVVALTARSLS